MIARLVQSALQTGYLSVESEGLLRQVAAMRSPSSTERQALENLFEAVSLGEVQREAQGKVEPLQELLQSAIVVR